MAKFQEKKEEITEKYIINGGTHLSGKVKVSGSKNATLPIVASTVMHPARYLLRNIPEIKDVFHMLEIVVKLGGKVEQVKPNTYLIDTRKIKSYTPSKKLVRNIRASILFIGSLLARFGKANIAQPGGCFIGSRPLNTHFKALRDLGVRIINKGDYYAISVKDLTKEKSIILSEMSVTATAIILMLASLGKKIEIRLAAAEPHIEDLCKFLSKMGLKLKGCGTHNITVFGQQKLKKYIEHTIIPDQIEAGTFAIAAAVSRAEVEILDFVAAHNDILLAKFTEMGVNYEVKSKNRLLVKRSTLLKACDIRTDVYPGFPTDLQAPMAVLLTQAHGNSEIHETMFEGRLNYIKELKKMGADVIVRDPHHAIVSGPTPLFGTTITSFDLRAGATLIIAALIAEGQSIIRDIHLIDRGYEKIDEKLTKLGANIKRVEV